MILHFNYIIYHHYIINLIFSMCIFQGIFSLSFVIVHPVMDKSDRRNTYQYKLIDSKLDQLKKLGALLIGDHGNAFKKEYGNLLGVLLTKEDARLILTFARFYDPFMHCFMFRVFLLAPLLKTFAHILHMLVRDQVPYMSADSFSESTMIAQALHLKKELVDSNLRAKGNVRGFTSKFLLEKATLFPNSGSWILSMLSLLFLSTVWCCSQTLRVPLRNPLLPLSSPRIQYPLFQLMYFSPFLGGIRRRMGQLIDVPLYFTNGS